MWLLFPSLRILRKVPWPEEDQPTGVWGTALSIDHFLKAKGPEGVRELHFWLFFNLSLSWTGGKFRIPNRTVSGQEVPAYSPYSRWFVFIGFITVLFFPCLFVYIALCCYIPKVCVPWGTGEAVVLSILLLLVKTFPMMSNKKKHNTMFNVETV